MKDSDIPVSALDTSLLHLHFQMKGIAAAMYVEPLVRRRQSLSEPSEYPAMAHVFVLCSYMIECIQVEKKSRMYHNKCAGMSKEERRRRDVLPAEFEVLSFLANHSDQ